MKQHIMITRPARQAGKLANAIVAAGGSPFLFPTLDICPSELNSDSLKKIQHLNQFDMIIFISPNAVKHGLNLISNLPQNILLATIGQGSAKHLESILGRKPDISPSENFNSEGLLATNAMNDVDGKRILIIRGNGGREHLKNVLQQRGANVEYLTAYQRIKPTTNPTELTQYSQNNEIAAIVITSAESLKNLVEMTPKNVISNLLQIPLLLINSRLSEPATRIGFLGKIYVSKEASDDAIVDSLNEYKLLNNVHN